jgi:hypothetical protein
MTAKVEESNEFVLDGDSGKRRVWFAIYWSWALPCQIIIQ